jgi:hypothetical protein
VTGSEDNHLTLNMTAQIDLHWNNTSQNEEGFRIERSPDSLPHDWSRHVDVGSGVTTYADTPLSCGVSYVYRVWAYKAGQYSIAPSAEVTSTTQSCPSLADFTAIARTRPAFCFPGQTLVEKLPT